MDDFLEENKLKRANSMKSLRQSKTISSFTTCDDSICLEDTKEGKLIINLNNIMVNNGDINQVNQKTKEMIQRSKNLYEVYFHLRDKYKKRGSESIQVPTLEEILKDYDSNKHMLIEL